MDCRTLIFLRVDEVLYRFEMHVGQHFIRDLPQPLGRLQLRGIRRLKEQMDALWHRHAVTGMPPGLIQHQDQVLVRSQAEKLR